MEGEPWEHPFIRWLQQNSYFGQGLPKFPDSIYPEMLFSRKLLISNIHDLHTEKARIVNKTELALILDLL